jgi:hypothetical protein
MEILSPSNEVVNGAGTGQNRRVDLTADRKEKYLDRLF